MAIQFKWTPEEVNRLDPHFVDELMARIEAESEHAEEARKIAERKAKRKHRP
jgi:hypothetical protein